MIEMLLEKLKKVRVRHDFGKTRRRLLEFAMFCFSALTILFVIIRNCTSNQQYIAPARRRLLFLITLSLWTTLKLIFKNIGFLSLIALLHGVMIIGMCILEIDFPCGDISNAPSKKKLNEEQSEFSQLIGILSNKFILPEIINCSRFCRTSNHTRPFSFRNLEECLICKDNMKPLTVDDRICIMMDVCKQLMHLHSLLMMLGDLKPENICLNSYFQSMLTGAGNARLLGQDVGSTIYFEEMFPNGTYSYIDPEYMITGELTHLSDIYSFGVILLRVLTGRSPVGLVIDMNKALERDGLKGMLDESAGEWPLMQVQQLVKIALKCCEILGENRPCLAEVLNVLRSTNASYQCSSSFLRNKIITEDNTPPSYFICPILQDVMTDPVIAADGYTYECEAIKNWLESGHTTSPMTNLELPNNNLIPNYGLRSAIKEWIAEESHI